MQNECDQPDEDQTVVAKVHLFHHIRQQAAWDGLRACDVWHEDLRCRGLGASGEDILRPPKECRAGNVVCQDNWCSEPSLLLLCDFLLDPYSSAVRLRSCSVGSAQNFRSANVTFLAGPHAHFTRCRLYHAGTLPPICRGGPFRRFQHAGANQKCRSAIPEAHLPSLAKMPCLKRSM